MKKLLAVLILGTLVACNTNLTSNHANNEIEPETRAKTLNEEEFKVPISNIDNIYYETSLKNNKDTKKLYIEKLAEQTYIENHAFENFLFYLVNEEENEAFIQMDISLTEKKLPNMERISFETIDLEGVSILIATLPLNDEENEIFAFGLTGEKLTNLTFDDKNSISSLQSNTLAYKQPVDGYIQTLDSKDEGYIFTTWKLNPSQQNFINYYQDVYTQAGEAIEIGQYFAERWLQFDDFFSEFPYYTFSKEDQEKISKGILVDLPHALGTPIDQVIEDYLVYDEDFFDGGPYYETKNGMLFYDEQTRLHNVAFISGVRIQNSHEIEDILGTPTSAGRSDMYPDEKYAFYKFNDYSLWLIYNDENELTRLELFSVENE